MYRTYVNYCYYRDSLKLTDYAVSKLSGVTTSTLSDWKNGKHQPNAKNMQKIAEALKISVDSFYIGYPGTDYNLKLNGGQSIDISEAITDNSLKRMIEYTYLLSSGEKIKLSQEEYSELKNAVDIFIDSWIRSKKKL